MAHKKDLRTIIAKVNFSKLIKGTSTTLASATTRIAEIKLILKINCSLRIISASFRIMVPSQQLLIRRRIILF